MFDMYEPAGEDEEGAYNVTITEDMSKDNVLKQVLDIIAKIWCAKASYIWLNKPIMFESSECKGKGQRLRALNLRNRTHIA